MPLRHGVLLLAATLALAGCRFEDRTPGGAQRDDTSLEQVARGFYAALAAHDPAGIERTAYSSANVLVDGGQNPPRLVPVHTMINVPDSRTSGVMPRIVRTELRTEGGVATARVVIAQAVPVEKEAVDFLTLARDGGHWRVAHAVFGPWRTRSAP